ncbi:hypothetical protein K431DRAFT_131598 [Polychaeton citri CBS 116435]|uniref:SnoaL-like domain-containing protein n=1 Tax=Polychaeton citri CBS 116435 TaxID=1314669 RepID=A0A9P4US79_9PEZI|nr:hypothetical protein K431DRAFT_131598 [Polychaeton citri CBS 116435]
MGELKSTQRLTAEAIVDAFNQMDIDAIVFYRAPECMRFILPASLNQPPTNNEQYRASLLHVKAVFNNFSLTINDIVEDTGASKICLWLSARADTLAGEYINEYMWTMEFDATGTRITKMLEFVDAGTYRDFWPKLQKAIKEQPEG